MMRKLGLLSPKQQQFIKVVRQSGIKYANAVMHIPEADNSVEVLYTCHMLEHLDRHEAEHFLLEVRRVLVPNGVIRVALPDLRFHVENYLKDADADAFVESLYVTSPKADGVIDKLKFLLVGERHHLWMYDGQSLCRLLCKVGFGDPRVLEAGKTTIQSPGKLDLAERVPESVFVEAINL
ncbi:MAG: methyltransferase domain-containing protein [Acidobacteriota bacterium]